MATTTRTTHTPPRWLWLLCTSLIASFGLLVFAAPTHAQAAPTQPITIPFTGAAVKLDGLCDLNGEYGNAFIGTVIYPTGGGGKVYLMHDNTNLYVCLLGATGKFNDRFASVYLDPNDSRDKFAQKDDDALRVDIISNTLHSLVGTGVANGYIPATIPGWNAVAHAGVSATALVGDSAEWSIPLSLVQQTCGKPFGIAVYHHWLNSVGDDGGWPSNQFFDQPQTWQEALIGGLDGPQLCQPDLKVTKQGPEAANLGASFIYTITVQNNGNATAHNVVISDTLPATLHFVSATPASCTHTGEPLGGTVKCPLGDVAPGESQTVVITVQPSEVGFVSNTAVGTTTDTDRNPQDNRSTVRTKINQATQPHGKIAYVFRKDVPTAVDFKTLLESNGFTVQLVRCEAVAPTDFTVFDEIIIADDTGTLDNWLCAPGQEPHIASAHKPVIGLGEGGYAFFGQLGKPIGWPHGWHGPQDRIVAADPLLSYFHFPNDFGSPVPSPLGLYAPPSNEVGIYLTGLPAVLPIGLEPVSKDHAPLIAEKEDCNQLWGFSNGPAGMTGDGKKLFVNAVVFGLSRPCSKPVPPQECISLVKSALPPDGTPVQPGDVIKYTLTYAVKNSPNCRTTRTLLQDKVPNGTLFVPGSATDGIAPAGGVLSWNLGPLGPGDTGSKEFKVYVLDTQCNEQKRIVNVARITSSLGIFTSNVVTHPLKCPPVTFPNNQPPYAEQEIQIYPYPMVTGHSTDLSVKVRNLLSTTQIVTVTFEGANFGIGQSFGPTPANPPSVNPRVVTLPPNGTVEVHMDWTPIVSGHYCIRVKIEGKGFAPIYTYRNLDVMEDLRPGQTDTLTFTVGNPTATVANVHLVVDNTCPGWNVSVNPEFLLNMAPGEERKAHLLVTPPNPAILGTACHIDVQGWIGDQLIGGIRKLDVPPINLPHSDPSWLEKEISTKPDPLVVGQPGQLCIELNNPFPFPRVVSVDFSVADFGAGVPFTPVGSLTPITLPANSLAKYCIPYTPPAGGTLHRCVLVTLHQAGFQDQQSQRNLQLRRQTIRDISGLYGVEIPFTVGNTKPFTQPLKIDVNVIGLPPVFKFHILPDPPPDLKPNETQNFVLRLEPVGDVNAASTDVAHDDAFSYGDTVRVDASVKLDGEEVSGFSMEFAPPEASTNQQIFLPLVQR